MDVTIVIVNYNTFRLTCACIESVIQYTKKVSYEIVLVDNASPNEDPDEFIKKFPSVNLIKSDINLGFAKGNNLGLQYANGKVILLLNSDTTLEDDSVSLAFDELIKDKSCGLLSSKLVYPDGRLQWASQPFKTMKQELYSLFKLHRYIKPLPTDIYDYLLADKTHYTDWVWGTFFMIKKEVLDMFPGGKLHDTFFMYGEDVQWCYAIHKTGYKIKYFPEAHVIHHIGASSGLTEELKFKKYIWPNEYRLLQIEKGKAYALLFILLKGLNAYASRQKSEYHWGKYFFKLAFSSII